MAANKSLESIYHNAYPDDIRPVGRHLSTVAACVITLHQNRQEKLRNIKKSTPEKMFV